MRRPVLCNMYKINKKQVKQLHVFNSTKVSVQGLGITNENIYFSDIFMSIAL